MENEINNVYIAEMLEQVSTTIGIKEPILYQELLSLIGNDKIKNATKFIA